MAYDAPGGTGNDVVLTALASVAPVVVPTLSEWVMILLATLLAGIGAHSASRRSRSAI